MLGIFPFGHFWSLTALLLDFINFDIRKLWKDGTQITMNRHDIDRKIRKDILRFLFIKKNVSHIKFERKPDKFVLEFRYKLAAYLFSLTVHSTK